MAERQGYGGMLCQENIRATVKALNETIRNQEISDFCVKKLENETLYLTGSFDLSYYIDIEIAVRGIDWLSLPYYFYVDLSLSEPFSICFLPEDIAVLHFEDCGERQTAEIHFTGGLTFTAERQPPASSGFQRIPSA